MQYAPALGSALTLGSFVIVTCASFSPWSAAQAGPVDWQISAGGNGHSYLPVLRPNGITWPQAQHEAIAAGGHLATIASMEENLFVLSLISDQSFWVSVGQHRGPWLGGISNPSDPNEWAWVTGEPFSYKNWALNEPSGEPWLHYLNKNGPFPAPTWNDLGSNNGEYPRGYVIEFEPSLCPTAVATMGLGTNGCQGPHIVTTSGCPKIGNSLFSMGCTSCPVGTLGMLIIGDSSNSIEGNTLGLGISLYVDLQASTELLLFDTQSDQEGFCEVRTPIPNSPALVGKTYAAQYLWLWTQSVCAQAWNPPFGLSASPALSMTIQN